MKIGLLTFHKVLNPGAFLQLLGTYRLLETMGHEPVVIDYDPPAHRQPANHLKSFFKSKFPFYTPRAHFDFLTKKKAYKNNFRTLSITRTFDTRSQLRSEHFDVVLVGADVVWNFKRPNLGQDPVYFGKDLATKKLISFAPSVGECRSTDSVPEYVKQGLKRFDAISVRDTTTSEIVEQELETQPTLLCDPAFHLSAQEFAETDINAYELPKRYILVYALAKCLSAKTIDSIKRYANENNCEIVAVFHRHSFANRNIVNIDPWQWAKMIEKAHCVVTNTFHGTIFSVLLRKKFASILTIETANKLDHITRVLGIERCVGHSEEICDYLQHNLNFDAVHEHLDTLRQEARSFLESNF